MHRTPLLRAVDGASLTPRCSTSPTETPKTPAWTDSPRSPTVHIQSADKLIRLVVGITGLTFLAFLGMIACMFTSGPESIARAFGTSTIQWGPDAATYQVCRVDNTNSLPNLIPVQRWSSSKVMPEESITAVTHISLDRLSALRDQCSSWSDRLAAVVYVPYIRGFGAVSTEGVAAVNGSSISSVITVIDMLHEETKHVHSQDGCALDIELIVEEFKSWEDPNIWLYPGNALRNRALMLADLTQLVLLLDRDQLPSSNLPRTYQTRPRTFSTLVNRLIKHRTAIVLPTLTPVSSGTTGSVRQVVGQAVSGGKEHAVAAWRRLDLGVVDFNGDLTDWAKAKKGNFQKIEYQQGSHPTLILPRKYVPFYDERFRGWVDSKEIDKALHATYLTLGLGLNLEVHPEAFVVHEQTEYQRQHNSGKDKLKSNKTWQESVYTEALEEILLGTYVPVTSFAKWCPRTERSSSKSGRSSLSAGTEKSSSTGQIMTANRKLKV